MNKQQGFTLVELSIVILIMGLLLGGLAMPLSVQRENARLKEASQQLVEVEEALTGFALVNGYLPCPATPSSNGVAAASGGACVRQHGFVPASTLGLTGARNGDNLLLDPWASPLRYSVSASDVDGDGNWDFTAVGEMRDVSIASLLPDLAVCRTAAGSSATGCADAATTLSASAPFVLLSLGKDWATSTGADQLENLGASVGGGPSGTSYAVANDSVFVERSRSLQSGNEYDDVITWSSPMNLYQRLVAGGQLP
jgi:prepilin-type N-terminal cleavage/methylation domain-containing protein